MDVTRWLRRRPSDAEMREEIETHLAMRAAHDGTDEAAARRRLGNVLQTREAMRRVWLPEWLDTQVQDVRYTWRSLRRSPAFTLTAALTLALAIGAATAVFSVVHAVLLRPLPYPDPDRLVRIYTTNMEQSGRPYPGTSIPDYLDWKAGATTFEAVEAYRENLHLDNHPERPLRLVHATPGLMGLLGVRTAIGRLMQDDDWRPDAVPVAILTYECWKGRFGGDPSILGRTVPLGEPLFAFAARGGPARDPDEIDAPSYTVIGVAEPIDPTLLGAADAFVPWVLEADEGRAMRRPNLRYGVLARRALGVTLAEVQAQLDAIGAALREQHPTTNAALAPVAVAVHDEAVSTVRPTLVALLGATGLLLLIAVSNIANLQIARVTTRLPELAVRAALGATRRRVARLLVTESIGLSCLGGLAGIGLAAAGLRLLRRLDPSWIPRLQDVGIDGTVLGVTLAVTVGAGLLFGLAPVLLVRGTSGTHVRRATGTAADERHWLRSGLVVVQLALSLVLLAGAGLMIRSVQALQAVPIGVDYRHVVAFGLGTGGISVGRPVEAQRAERLVRYREIVEHVRAIPDVRAVTLASQSPLSIGAVKMPLDVLTGAEAGQTVSADLVGVSADFFDFFGRRAVAGRLFEPGDEPMADRRVVVDASLARRIWPVESPVGQRIRFLDVESEVIGVVEPIRYGRLRDDMAPNLFHLLDRSGVFGATVLVRHDGDPVTMMEAIEARLHTLDPTLPPVALQPLAALYERDLREPRFHLLLLGLLGAIGLAVAVVGVYGVVAYAVARRTGEIAIRLALGARRRQVAGLCCRRTVALVAAGLGAGLIAAVVLARFIENLLFQVLPTDPVALGSMAALLAAAALAATLMPLRRALRVDPATTLRAE